MKFPLLIVMGLSLFCYQDEAFQFLPDQPWCIGRISTTLPEFSFTSNATETEVFFNRASPDRSVLQIMCLRNYWSEAAPLSFSNGQYRDLDPFLSEDGNRLYFSSNRPKTPRGEAGDFDTWYVERVQGKWSEPINPGKPLNSDSSEIFFTMSKNGDAYFVSERNGSPQIMVSKFKQGKYQSPKKLCLKLRGENITAGNPCIASDASFLIVAARDPQGKGDSDLFISKYKHGKWSALKNMGPKVNSSYTDFAPSLSKDNRFLYFTSERPGVAAKQKPGVRPPGDIYKVNLQVILAELF